MKGNINLDSSKTIEMKINVSEQTADLFKRISDNIGMTPGQIVDQMALIWISSDLKEIAPPIFNPNAIHIIKNFKGFQSKTKTEKRRARDSLEKASINALIRRITFMKQYEGKSEDINLFVDVFAKKVCDVFEGVDLESAVLERLFDIEEDSDWQSILKEEYNSNPVRTFGRFAYTVLEKPNARYFNQEMVVEKNTALDVVYDFLQKLGYKLSDEELSLKDGTHIAFNKE